MRIAFAGTPDFALPSLAALAASRHAVVGVMTPPDRPAGRGRHTRASPVKLAAEALGFPLAQPASPGSDEGLASLRAWSPDVLVVVAYGHLLPQTVLHLPRLGCLNVHASLLPRWRGAAPIERAILAGDRETGVTIMQMDAGLDTGAILLQRAVPLEPTVTGGQLRDTLARLGAEALLEALDDVEAGRARPRAQPSDGVTHAAKIDKTEALIDWRWSAAAIDRQVRAFDPRPVAQTRLEGEALRVVGARALSLEAGADPGTLVELTREAVVVACGEGRLAITRLQRPGRRALAAAEFVHGERLEKGRRLG